jgi:peroxiredoxin
LRDRQLFLILLGLVGGIGLGLWYLLGQDAAAISSGAISNLESLEIAPRAGFRAPDFELESLDGELIRLNDLRGRAVLINFWATWCGPCRVEMPDIQEQYVVHSPDLVVLAIDMDESQDTVAPFVEELGLTFPVLLDPGGKVNGESYNVRGYPSSFFVDKDGVIRVVQIGLMTPGQLKGYLEEVGITG